jgi:hypothetical protein
MTRDILDRAADAVEGTTPGPWRVCRDGICTCGHVWSTPENHPVATATQSPWGEEVYSASPTEDDPQRVVRDFMEYGSFMGSKANARFIAASRQLVPDMAEEIAAMRRTIDLIASGQVDAVALARAEKRRWNT